MQCNCVYIISLFYNSPYLLINVFTIISLVLVILGFQIGIGGSFFAWATEVFPLHVRCIYILLLF